VRQQTKEQLLLLLDPPGAAELQHSEERGSGEGEAVAAANDGTYQ
jgi:hypothetical protein